MTTQEAFNLANQHYRKGEIAQAAAICRQIIAADPGQAEVWHLLGLANYQARDASAALEAIARAIAIQPGRMDFYYNQALVLDTLKRSAESEAALAAASRCEGMDAELLNQVGKGLYFSARMNESLVCAEKLLRLRPEDAKCHWNYGILLLHHGRYAEGWREFEWRHLMPSEIVDKRFTTPQWDGGEMPGRALLVHAEGGFGDSLFYCRYVPLLAGKVGKGARVVMECQKGLIPLLMASYPGVDQFVERGHALPAFDEHVFLPSLAGIFGTELGNIPNEVPYVKPPKEKLAEWGRRVPKDGLRNVGLVWSGNRLTSPDDKRSMALAQLAPLAGIGGVRYFNLQVGKEGSEVRPEGLELVDFTTEIHDFADTAALVAQLDLIISVDTSVAHLAGALGKPVWLLVQYVPAYQWLLERNDSPWYPTMRLFRQPRLGDWESVVGQVAEALKKQ